MGRVRAGHSQGMCARLCARARASAHVYTYVCDTRARTSERHVQFPGQVWCREEEATAEGGDGDGHGVAGEQMMGRLGTLMG